MAKNSIIVIDYGSGNLRSAAKAFEKVVSDEGLDINIAISGDPKDIKSASRIVLPGQGAFADCMSGLKAIPGMVDALEDAVVRKGRPFLGICVGMQLMATRGLEHGVHAGLDWIPGEVVPLQPDDKNLKIPHMGWNEIMPTQAHNDNAHPLLRSIDSSTHYYFVHSFMFQCQNKHHILGQADYGGLFPAIVGRDNMAGVQFHPEKSQEAGLKLIKNFLQWKP